MEANDFVLISCDSERYRLEVPLSLPVSHLKSLISFRHQFGPGVRIVHRGAVMPADTTLSLSGVTSGSLLVVVPPKSDVTLRIIPGSGSPFIATVPMLSPVSDLRSLISDRLTVHPDQLHLVHDGQILADPFTLNYYKLFDGAAVYTVLIKRSPQPRAKPSELLGALREKVSQFTASSPTQQRRLAWEVTALVNNPILQSYVKIDMTARLVVEDACLTLEAVEGSTASEINQVVGAISDLVLVQLEATAAGMRLLREELAKKERPRPQVAAPLTRLDYVPAIAEEPLPVWWSSWPVELESGALARDRSGAMQEPFSQEIRVLKRMGFSDEKVIVMALKKTAGNVQRAAKLLMRTPPNRCA